MVVVYAYTVTPNVGDNVTTADSSLADSREKLKSTLNAIMRGQGPGWSAEDRAAFRQGFANGFVDGLKSTVEFLKMAANTATTVYEYTNSVAVTTYAVKSARRLSSIVGDRIASWCYGITPLPLTDEIAMANTAIHRIRQIGVVVKQIPEILKNVAVTVGEVGAVVNEFAPGLNFGGITGIAMPTARPSEAQIKNINRLIDEASPLTIKLLSLTVGLTPEQQGYVAGMVLEQVMETAAITLATAGVGAVVEGGVELPRAAQLLRKIPWLAKDTERLAAVEKAVSEARVLGNTAEEAARTAKIVEEAAQRTALVPKSTVELGKWGEARLAHDLGYQGAKPSSAFKTSLGKRFFDRLVNGVAHEAKAGVNVGLTPSIRMQVLKDAELIARGKIRGAVWHFYQGAQQELLDFLSQHGIQYVVH